MKHIADIMNDENGGDDIIDIKFSHTNKLEEKVYMVIATYNIYNVRYSITLYMIDRFEDETILKIKTLETP